MAQLIIMKSIKFYFASMLLFTNSFVFSAPNVPINELIGQFDEKIHPEFVALDSTILPVNKSGMYLRKRVVDKLITIYQDFKQAHPDIPFVIVSATRNYSYQNGIWLHKWKNTFPKHDDSKKTANEILRYSAMPGTSRHHWGTDVDITSLESDYFLHDPKGKILYNWLNKNMSKYGFCRPYTEGRKRGYQPEEWHWSFKPLSKRFITSYRHYLDQNKKFIWSKLNFEGHEHIDLEALVEEYVFSISQACY